MRRFGIRAADALLIVVAGKMISADQDRGGFSVGFVRGESRVIEGRPFRRLRPGKRNSCPLTLDQVIAPSPE